MIYIGIDNGLFGGIVAINSNEDIIFKTPMPLKKLKNGLNYYDIKKIINLLDLKDDSKDNVLCVLEQCHPRPISGKRACFTNGEQYGIILGILNSLNIKYIIVSPTKWLNVILGKEREQDINKPSVNFCIKKYPNEDWKKSEKSKRYNDGLTDACCIALFGKKYYEAKQNE